eukprot:c29331_g2_i2 orf=1-1479(+)
MTVNLGKTKVLIFHTSARVRRQSSFTAAGGDIEITSSYVYLGVTFTATSGAFSMTQAARDRLTRGYSALAQMERECHQAHFQEPRTKGWLFDTLVTPALMYGVAIWGPGLTDATWTLIERPQVLMISRLIRSKASVPHDIVRAELAAPPMLVEALFQTVCMLHRFQDMDRDQIAYRAFMASRELAMGGDTSSWYAQTRDWLARHGIDIDRLPPLQYDTQAPTYLLSHGERNRVIRQELWHTYIQRTWTSPVRPLPPKMSYYYEHFLSISEQGFIETPQYMQIYMPHRLRVAIGQLRVSSHQLAIESGRAHGIPREERICQICRTEVESEEHMVIQCPAYSEIRARYTLRPTLRQCLTDMDQRQFGRFLAEALHTREERLHQSTTAREPSQTTLTQFFSTTTTSRHQGEDAIPTTSQRSGLTLAEADVQRRRRRPRLGGYRTPHIHLQDIQRIETIFRQQMESRLRSTHWSDILRSALHPAPMYHILHPIRCH